MIASDLPGKFLLFQQPCDFTKSEKKNLYKFPFLNSNFICFVLQVKLLFLAKFSIRSPLTFQDIFQFLLYDNVSVSWY